METFEQFMERFATVKPTGEPMQVGSRWRSHFRQVWEYAGQVFFQEGKLCRELPYDAVPAVRLHRLFDLLTEPREEWITDWTVSGSVLADQIASKYGLNKTEAWYGEENEWMFWCTDMELFFRFLYARLTGEVAREFGGVGYVKLDDVTRPNWPQDGAWSW